MCITSSNVKYEKIITLLETRSKTIIISGDGTINRKKNILNQK